jgi:hypothetical protein
LKCIDRDVATWCGTHLPSCFPTRCLRQQLKSWLLLLMTMITMRDWMRGRLMMRMTRILALSGRMMKKRGQLAEVARGEERVKRALLAGVAGAEGDGGAEEGGGHEEEAGAALLRRTPQQTR